ncbi:hypothetical protein [Leptolyngbya sp. KIOST-1]|uniref:hypothetical protein n=1 Tax=Leptolyngbya sp. KIOST-1 TaxID=1229172 RepID=UPI00056D3A9F|nr:hypothetical protein [Leptolyngbya sp. KIOST-1]
MKPIYSLLLAIATLPTIYSAALADESLGNVIRDSIRDEIRDDIRDTVRRDICDRRADRNRDPDLCNTLDDIDQFRDGIRRGRNRIRAIDAIFN